MKNSKKIDAEEDTAIKAWVLYYDKRRSKNNKVSEIGPFAAYQNIIIKEALNEFRKRSSSKSIEVWSAGSGIDLISLHLKRELGESISITIQDISEKCISENRKIFKENGMEAKFLVEDIFDSKFVEKFDIVFNTGLLEHFDKKNQERLLDIFSRSLKEGGVYLTSTPSLQGKVYNHCMKKMKGINIWPYGPENPVMSLQGLNVLDLRLETECPVGALDQISFVEKAYPILGIITIPVLSIARRLQGIVEPTLIKIIGGYCIFDKFVKIKNSPRVAVK